MMNQRTLPSFYLFLILLPLIIFVLFEFLAQTETFCPPGQAPQFIHGFAFLKSQLGELMGEALECEHYDAAGNAFQRTSTGQAFYLKQTNTPMFTRGDQHWRWTAQGLEYWVDNPVTPTVAAGPVTTRTIRVMSYNILFGAGATPDWEYKAAHQTPFSNPGNRLPGILAVIKAAEPDIVGIQEAAGWDRLPSPIVEQVAGELGMNHFMAHSPSALNVALFTKFEIVEAENLTEQVGNIGALRATLALPGSGQQLQVVVVHLDPFSAEARERQITTLIELMAPHRSMPTLLMGDLNMSCLKEPEHCREYQLLIQAGWQLAAREKYLINQIWTSPGLGQPVEEIIFPGANFKISDHLPVGAVLRIPPIP